MLGCIEMVYDRVLFDSKGIVPACINVCPQDNEVVPWKHGHNHMEFH